MMLSVVLAFVAMLAVVSALLAIRTFNGLAGAALA